MKRKYFVSYQELDENHKVLKAGQMLCVFKRKINKFKDIEEIQENIGKCHNCNKKSFIHILSINYLGWCINDKI